MGAVDVLDMLILQAEGELEEQQQEMAMCDPMVAEMQADLGIDPMEALRGTDDTESPF